MKTFSATHKCFLFALIIACITFFASMGFSENVRERNTKNCIPLSAMTLTETQKHSLEVIQADFRKDILRIRSTLLAKRIELNGQLRDPTIDEKTIWNKAQEIETLNNKLEEIITHNLLLIRRVLTIDQIKSWCAGAETPATKGWRS